MEGYEIRDHILILSESLMMSLDGPDDESDHENEDLRGAAEDDESGQSESDDEVPITLTSTGRTKRVPKRLLD